MCGNRPPIQGRKGELVAGSAQGLDFRIEDFGIMIQDLGFRVWSLGV